jgi:hypothetical protein
MNPISNVSSSVTNEALAAVRLKLLHDSPPENSQNSKVSADYIALQAAINSGNSADAEADLGRLQVDTLMANPPAAMPGPSSKDRSAGTEQSPTNDQSAPRLDTSA